MKRTFQILKYGGQEVLGTFSLDDTANVGNINDDKYYFVEELVAADIAEHRLLQCDRVNMAAGRARARFISPGTGMDAVYLLKADEARRFLSDGGVGTPEEYPLINSECLVSAQSMTEVAQMFLSIEAGWKTKAAEIEFFRRQALANIGASQDETDIQEFANLAIASLEAVT